MSWPWDIREEYAHQLVLLRESIVAREDVLDHALERTRMLRVTRDVEYDAWRAAEEAKYQLQAFDYMYRAAKEAWDPDPDGCNILLPELPD